MQLTQVDMQIEQSEETLLDLEKQAFEEQQTQEVNLRNATDQLLGQLAAWEQHYLLRSPVGGKVTFLNVWSVNQYVESGATVFVGAPKEESLPVGTALLPLQGSGKVKAGQRVNLRLNNYPDQEFGYVRGEVRSVSPLPTAEGMYVVEGPRIERMLGYTNLDSEKGFEFFQKFLRTSGIVDELEKLGIEEGDTVRMYGLQFDYLR